MDFEDRLVLSEAIGYLEGLAKETFKRRNPWWKFWIREEDPRKIYALEISMHLRYIMKKFETNVGNNRVDISDDTVVIPPGLYTQEQLTKIIMDAQKEHVIVVRKEIPTNETQK